MIVGDAVKSQQFACQRHDGPGPFGDSDDRVPFITPARRLTAQAFGVCLALTPSRDGQEELTDRAALGFRTYGEFGEPADGNNVHVEPSERAGIVIMALGENRLEPCQRLELVEVDLVDLVERGANGAVDVEVAAGEYRAGVEELFEDRERPGVQLRERLLKLAVGRFRKASAQKLGIRNETRALLEQVDNRDRLEQAHMKGVAADCFASLQCFSGQRPSVPVGRREYRRLKVGAEVVPKPVRAVQLPGEGLIEEVLKAVRLGGVEEAKNAALVLAETPPGNRSQQTRHDRMQWPACFEHGSQPLGVVGTIPPRKRCDGGSERAWLLRAMIALDRAGDEVDLFFARGVDDEIDETALYLCPFVAHFVR